jgi:hypothetical protein
MDQARALLERIQATHPRRPSRVLRGAQHGR